MAKRVALDKLSDAIKEILDDYADDINNGLNDAVKAATQKGAVAVRAKAREIVKQPSKDGKPKPVGLKITGEYIRGWSHTMLPNNDGTVTGIIHNKNKPQLGHLLEYGHASNLPGVDRVPAYPHVKPVEDEIAATFTDEVAKKLREVT